ncbi:MAG: hypothetical protein L0H19_02875 [Salinisphaera sp.]|nr:hypothetical protein [Salinisphaera sp.]
MYLILLFLRLPIGAPPIVIRPGTGRIAVMATMDVAVFRGRVARCLPFPVLSLLRMRRIAALAAWLSP